MAASPFRLANDPPVTQMRRPEPTMQPAALPVLAA